MIIMLNVTCKFHIKQFTSEIINLFKWTSDFICCFSSILYKNGRCAVFLSIHMINDSFHGMWVKLLDRHPADCDFFLHLIQKLIFYVDR